jgi:signal transduction histidine kinase
MFVAIFGAIWIIASFVIYFASSSYRKEEFYRRLNSRAELIARLLIDEDQVDASLLQKIENANPIRLPGEKISVFDFNNVEIFTTDTDDNLQLEEGIFNKIRLEGVIEWTQKPGDIEVIGLLYKGQYDRFVVIAGANDIYGLRKLSNLRNILITTFFVSMFIAAIVGKIYAGRALAPISHVMDQVNHLDPNKLNGRVSEGNGTDEIALLGVTFNNMLSRMQSAFESQKQFIANSSHEMRTPLTRILTQVDLTLLKPQTDGEYQKTLSIVKDEVNRISDLTSKLLLLTKLDGFKESLNVVRIDNIIWQLIESVKIAHPNCVLKVSMSDQIEDESQLQIKGNDQLMTHLFQNLVDNAIKYGNESEIEIELSAIDNHIKVSVTDRGIGIPKVDMDKIGATFFRASNSTSAIGSGIGLSLVKRICEVHGGSLEITSKEGQGTSVSVFFPLA